MARRRAFRRQLEPVEELHRQRDVPPLGDHAGAPEWQPSKGAKPQRLAGCRISWFDDSGHGACRLPQGARLLYRDGDEWKPVTLRGANAVPIALDRWCEVQFAPVATTALRLEVTQQEKWSSGVLEWRLVAAEDD